MPKKSPMQGLAPEGGSFNQEMAWMFTENWLMMWVTEVTGEETLEILEFRRPWFVPQETPRSLFLWPEGDGEGRNRRRGRGARGHWG